MLKAILTAITPDFDFLMLQALAMTITAILLPKLKITGFFGPFFAVLGISWFNQMFWDSKLFYAIPQGFSLDWIALLIANSFILWVIIKVVPGIEIRGIITPFIAGFLFSISSMLINKYGQDIDWQIIFGKIISVTLTLKTYFLAALGL